MRLIPRFVLRAPLLPVRDLADPVGGLARAALGPGALALASPSLAEHADARAERARRRYGRRAAFRPTPHGLLAGVCVGEVVDGPSRVELGEPRAHLTLRYDRLAALGRALLDTEPGWNEARLRRAPSLLEDEGQVSWTAYGEAANARRLHAEVDPLLRRVLDATARWTSASGLAKKLRAALGDLDTARAFLLQLVDDNLLHHDLEPPLVGPPPLAWSVSRLARLCPALPQLAAQLADDARSIEDRLVEAELAIAELPGAMPTALHSTLVHTGRVAIARAPLERAAAVAPFLFRLNEALSPPIRERDEAALDDLFASVSAIAGEGLLPLAPLELGAYGAVLEPPSASIDAASGALTALSELIVEAARSGREEIVLDSARLDEVLPRPALPSSFELQLTPCASTGQEGEDWLLGLHAPAGASWGRHADALGAPLAQALLELRQAERQLDGEACRIDVAYAPSRALADLCTVPALRDAALAVSTWPEEGAVTPAQCAVVNEPAGPAHAAVVANQTLLLVSPLHRVRSTTAPLSVIRVLLADTLVRQHAPWAMSWGPLVRLPWLPRVRVQGFVVAPQSWALPVELDEEAIAAWRSAARPPRHVLVGTEDALLPIDLDEPEDRASLIALPAVERTRVHEIWPPLGRELDAGGRRIELSCAVVAGGVAESAERVAELGLVPRPKESAAAGWRTVKVYAPRDRQARLLVEVIAPFIARARLAGWFFLPFVDPPSREHLRVRLRAADEAAVARAAETLARHLRADPAVATVEVGSYHREHARYGAGMEAVEKVFESDSRLVVDLLAADMGDLAIEAVLALGFDALAAGVGLEASERLAVARAAFGAYQIGEVREREELAPGYRSVQRELLVRLEDPPPALVAHRQRLRAARLGRRLRDRLPTLLHLAAVRLCGPDRDAELRALYLWARALESSQARGKPSSAGRRSKRSAPARPAPPRSGGDG